jgi:membrane fusion protein (multidrug efflux system)
VQQVRARLGLPEQGEDLRDVRNAAEVKKAQADLNDAEQKYQRAKTLLARNLVARESFDEADSRYKSARAAYDLAIQTVENLRAQLAQNRALLELARKKLNDSTIRAPFAGEIKERTVTVGQYLIVQSPVMAIVSVDPLRARLKIPEKMAAWIQVGQTVSVSVEAYPGQTFSGKISRLNPSVEQQTRTFEAEALIANRDGKLKPGFFIKASIPSGLVDKALFVPERAVLYSYGVYKVFLIDKTTLREKEVRIGEHPNLQVEIVDGLREGDGIALPPKGIELRDRAEVEIIQ